MGVIPEFRRTIGPASAVDPGAIERAGTTQRAIAGVANNLSNIGFDMAIRQKKIEDELAMKQKQADDAAYVSTKSIDLEVEAKDIYNSWQQENMSNPTSPEARTKLKEYLDNHFDISLADAPSTEASGAMKRVSDSMTGNLLSSSVDWANKQHVVNLRNSAKLATDKLRLTSYQDGFEGNAPIITVDDNLRKHDTVVAGFASLGPEAQKSMNAEGKRGIAASGIEGMLDAKRFGAAQQALHKYADILGPDEYKRLNEQAHKAEKTAKELTENVLTKKTTDPYEFYMKQEGVQNAGQLKGFSPINWDNPDLVQITNRQRWVDAKNRDNQNDTPFLPPSEEAQLVEKIAKGKPSESAEYLYQLSSQLTKEQAKKIGDQLYQKDEQKPLAAAFGMARESQDVAEKIIKGYQLVHEKGFQPVKAEVFETEFERLVRNAIPSANARGQIKAAVGSVALYNLNRDGKKSPADINAADIEAALTEVAGAPLEVNKYRTFSFKGMDKKTGKLAWVDEDDFADTVNDMTPESWQKFTNGQPHKDNKPIPWDKITANKFFNSQNIRFESAADGRYSVIDVNGEPMRLKDNKIFLIDIKGAYNNKPADKEWFKYIPGLNK